MKCERLFSYLTAAGLAFCLGFSGVACIVTGFDLKNAELLAIALSLAAFALAAGGLVFFCRYGWAILAGIFCLGGGLSWRIGVLEQSVEALLEQITQRYRLGYGTPVIHWSGSDLSEVSVNMALCLVAMMVMLTVLAVLRFRKSAVLTLPICILPLCACMVVTDTVPHVCFLVLLIAAMALLALTNMVRRRDERDGNRLTLRLLIPILLITMLLFWVMPGERPQLQIEINEQELLGLLQDLPFVQMGPNGILHLQIETIDYSHFYLTSVGPKKEANFRVMTVRSRRGGVVYLRGQSFDYYDGKQWVVSNLKDRDYWVSEFSPDLSSLPEHSCSWRTEGMDDAGIVEISTAGQQGMLFTPYYLGEEDLFSIVGGMVPNKSQTKKYTFGQYVPYGKNTQLLYLGTADWLRYTYLPDGSADKLHRIAINAEKQYRKEHLVLPDFLDDEQGALDVGLGGENSLTDRDYLAQAIGEYVRKSARYSVSTPFMPEEEEDFALWFLEDSETGYCIHFATAATVLLRALHVPARVVTGYAMEMEPGKNTEVSAEKAHAWVEYFSNENGWQILDPTPGSVGDPSFVPTVTPVEPGIHTTKPSEPKETEASTDPTQLTLPFEPTMPTHKPAERPTRPVQKPTRPTGPDDTIVEEPADLQWLWMAMTVLGGTLMAIALVIGQAEIRLYLRLRKTRVVNTNARCIGLWREVDYRCGRMFIKRNPGLLEIAEKAKFSQHTVSKTELEKMEQVLQRTEEILRYSDWRRRLVCYLIWAIR